ncbi:hypothetical protein DY000_02008590 [Brassica cretica]|uniref:DUF1985 domain-containing protein n=1 Tax=Brassica cretica TaxID=69181 RepID=A0ABQ7BT20_BRACR|nr:hypothetical protein DY000_02008590 [Brassica cretica]
MLLLTESILLQKVSGSDTAFPLDYVKIAHDIDVLMTYPWGRIAYELLLKSLKNVVDNNLDKNKYELHGFPLAFHLWILESVPLLSPFYVLEIENDEHLKVTCILPSITHNPEADVSIEDKDDQDLDDMADLSKKVIEMGQASSSNDDVFVIRKAIQNSALLIFVDIKQQTFIHNRHTPSNTLILPMKLLSWRVFPMEFGGASSTVLFKFKEIS